MKVNIIQTETENEIRLSTQVTFNHKNLELWFEIPRKFKPYLTHTADPFVIALLFPAMREKISLEIENLPISKVLLRNLQELQLAWNVWKPEIYSPVSISGQLDEKYKADKENAICAFTGGIDGGFVLWNHLLNPENKFPISISALLYVEGFHIPLSETESSDEIKKNIQKIADELNLEFIHIKTNIRRFGDWYDFHGAALVACLTLFKKKFNHGLFGSSHPYKYLRFPWGTNLVTDPLFSSGNFTVINEGASSTRIQKIEKLKSWDSFQNQINVCTKKYVTNCCRCEKCIRTILGYKALNLTLPKTLTKEINPWHVLTLKAYQYQEIGDYSDLLSASSNKARWSTLFICLRLNIFLNRIIRILLEIFGLKKILTKIKKRNEVKIYQ